MLCMLTLCIIRMKALLQETNRSESSTGAKGDGKANPAGNMRRHGCSGRASNCQHRGIVGASQQWVGSRLPAGEQSEQLKPLRTCAGMTCVLLAVPCIHVSQPSALGCSLGRPDFE